MKRASNETLKQERRNAILDMAGEYLEKHSFEEIRLTDMAKDLGIVKGTLYLYFSTKHDLFAAVLIKEMESWWIDLKKIISPESNLGQCMASSLSQRGLLVRLVSSLHMGIEPGMTPDGLKTMKHWFHGFLFSASSDLEQTYSGLKGIAPIFLLQAYALIVGSAQLCFPPSNVSLLLDQDPELAVFRIDLGKFLAVGLDRLFLGATNDQTDSKI